MHLYNRFEKDNRLIYCQNCGRLSHCGLPQYTALERTGGEHSTPEAIKTCNTCRCINCHE